MTDQTICADFSRSDHTARLAFKGPLELRTADEAKKALQDALASPARRVDVDLQGVTEADLAGLQLICSAHKAALSVQKELAIRWSERLRRLAEAAGFLRHHGCVERCLWAEGGSNG